MATILIISLLIVSVPLALVALATRLESGSAERLRKRQQAPAIAGELPWWGIEEDGAIVGVDLRYSFVLELVGVDVDCMSNEGLEQLQGSIHAMLVSLPAETRLQYIHINDHNNEELVARYTSQVTSPCAIATAVKRARLQQLADSPRLRRSRLYLCVTLPHSQHEVLSRLSGPNKFETVSEYEHEEQRIKLQNLARQVTGALQSASVECRQLIRDEVRALSYEFLNPTRARTMGVPPNEDLPYSEQHSMREKLALSDLEEHKDTLSLDGRLIRVLTLRGLPTATDPALLEGLTVGLPFSCRVQMTLSVTDDQKALDALKRKRDRAAVHMEGRKRNQEAEAATHDLEDLIDKNLASSIRMVRVGLSIVLSVDEKASGAAELLDYQTAETLRVLTTLNGCVGMVETYAQLDSWLACLPANSHHRERMHLCTSLNAGHMALQYQGWPGHHKATILLEDARNHLMGLDPFDGSLANPNAFIAGSSGSGKSVTTNYLLLHLFASGAKGLIIDIGGSYRRLLTLYGGEYFTFDDPGAALNLFYEPVHMVAEDGSLDGMRMRIMLAVLESLLVEAGRESLRHDEIAVLEASVASLYQEAIEAPILSDLQHRLQSTSWDDAEDTEIARKLARSLKRWTQGAHASLLNRPGSVNLSTGFAGFDLKGLADEVQAPVLLILSGTIWDLVKRDPTEKKVIIFDEVWKLLKSKTAQELIEELYRTSRKYRASVVSISQSVEDFVTSPIASALVSNSSTKYLLRHLSGHKAIADTFHLNSRELDLFHGLEMRRGEYSEVLVMAGEHHHFVSRVVLSPLEYWIATTHPPDLAFLALVTQDMPHASLSDVLIECAYRAPNGAEALPRPHAAIAA